MDEAQVDVGSRVRFFRRGHEPLEAEVRSLDHNGKIRVQITGIPDDARYLQDLAAVGSVASVPRVYGVLSDEQRSALAENIWAEVAAD